RQRQAYFASNTDFEVKVVWRKDKDTYNIYRWQVILQWFDVVVITTEILVNLLNHPLLNFRTQYLLIVDDCIYHSKGKYCFDSLLALFYDPFNPEHVKQVLGQPMGRTQDGEVDVRIITANEDEVIELRQRPPPNGLEWYYAIAYPHADIEAVREAIIAIENDDDTWRWCGTLPEEKVIELEGWDSGRAGRCCSILQDTIVWSNIDNLVGTIYPLHLLPLFDIAESGPPLMLHCWLTLPPASPVKEIYSTIFSTKDLAMRHVAFNACMELHKEGVLDDLFLPREIRQVEFIEIDDEPSQEDVLPSPSAVHAPLDEAARQRTVVPAINLIGPVHRAIGIVGASFFKMLLAVDLFIGFPRWNECQMTMKRTKALSGINPRCKTGAAIAVGEAYLTRGVEWALKGALQILNQPLSGINRWEDYASSFLTSRRSTTLAQIPIPEAPNLMEVESIIGYVFKDKTLLLEALSQAENTVYYISSYERLEYLGDAVLDVVAAVFWIVQFPRSDYNVISALTMESVSNKALQTVCIASGLHRYIWNRKLELSDRIISTKASLKFAEYSYPHSPYWRKAILCKTLADVIESLLGAVFMDSGLNFGIVAEVFEKIHWPVIGKHLMTFGNSHEDIKIVGRKITSASALDLQ
ncbi:hypothetical protein BGZ65_008842, partial [Modicella reniformis]